MLRLKLSKRFDPQEITTNVSVFYQVSETFMTYIKLFFLGSTRDQINKQYKKMAILLHPDKSLAPGAEEAFKLLTIARSQLLRYAN